LIYEDVADLLDGRNSSISSPELQANIRKMQNSQKFLNVKEFSAVQYSSVLLKKFLSLTQISN